MVLNHQQDMPLFLRGLLVIFFLLFFFNLSTSGQNDSDRLSDIQPSQMDINKDTVILKQHSPHRATIYSMVLPGLGQAYNRKYWKIPIIYAGFGTFYYFIHFNSKEYQLYKEAYDHKSQNADGSEPPVNEYEALYDTDYLLKARDYYRRNRDLSYILSGVWYILNVIDAAVDAHLFTWEVDEDLTLRVEPEIFNPSMIGFQPAGGIRLTMKF